MTLEDEIRKWTTELNGERQFTVRAYTLGVRTAKGSDRIRIGSDIVCNNNVVKIIYLVLTRAR